MPPRVNSATLNVQPRQRRAVYQNLSELPNGSSVKDLIGRLDIPESELRETLRKLETAGLARRARGMWQAIPLGTAEAGSDDGGPDAAAGVRPQD
jgi:predicted ArsR family transcriptional regulator